MLLWAATRAPIQIRINKQSQSAAPSISFSCWGSPTFQSCPVTHDLVSKEFLSIKPPTQWIPANTHVHSSTVRMPYVLHCSKGSPASKRCQLVEGATVCLSAYDCEKRGPPYLVQVAWLWWSVQWTPRRNTACPSLRLPGAWKAGPTVEWSGVEI